MVIKMMIVVNWIIELYWVGKITLLFNFLAIVLHFRFLYARRYKKLDYIMSGFKDVLLSLLLFLACLFWYLGKAQPIFNLAGENNILLHYSNVFYLIFEPTVGVLNFLGAVYVLYRSRRRP